MFRLFETLAYTSRYDSNLNDLGVTTGLTFKSNDLSVWIIISAVLAIVGALVGYFFFARQKREKFTGFVAKLHDFVNFKRVHVEGITKALYIGTALYISLSSFGLISTSFVAFITMLTLGNVLAWVGFQFMMMGVRIFTNTHDINQKLKK